MPKNKLIRYKTSTQYFTQEREYLKEVRRYACCFKYVGHGPRQPLFKNGTYSYRKIKHNPMS